MDPTRWIPQDGSPRMDPPGWTPRVDPPGWTPRSSFARFSPKSNVKAQIFGNPGTSRLCVSTDGAAEPGGSGRVWDQPHPKNGAVWGCPCALQVPELIPNPAELLGSGAAAVPRSSCLPERANSTLSRGFGGIQGGIPAQSPGCAPRGSDPALGSRYTNPRTGRFRSGDATQCRVLFVRL